MIEAMASRRSSSKAKTPKGVSLRKVINGAWTICEKDRCWYTVLSSFEIFLEHNPDNGPFDSAKFSHLWPSRTSCLNKPQGLSVSSSQQTPRRQLQVIQIVVNVIDIVSIGMRRKQHTSPSHRPPRSPTPVSCTPVSLNEIPGEVYTKKLVLSLCSNPPN